MKFRQLAPTPTPPVPAFTVAVTSGSSNTTSQTLVSTGKGLSIKLATTSGSMLVSATFTGIRQNTVPDLADVQLFWNTTGIPANGTSVGSDNAIVPILQLPEPVANQNIFGSISSIVTGLSQGTTYYVYVAFGVTTAGTTTTIIFASRMNLYALELAAS